MAGVSYLDNCVPEVTKMYVTSRLESVKVCLGNTAVDDPLDNDELLTDQLEAVSPLCRFQCDMPLPDMSHCRFNLGSNCGTTAGMRLVLRTCARCLTRSSLACRSVANPSLTNQVAAIPILTRGSA